ncbi:hypothetical protein [Pseudonocardia humida]|uniref:Signal transduction histidine kinase dimerisation/phosphoacceptor domain-containing protein n=1 Tax=Pseudonocardia humida TaxID=2800819 RepID=A0ABT1A5U2_9PSEU|nr:hypothetical protein [Pseudonocardia humida]MCO1658296.1 hypothetical protein [Pseudonocardia humida]
MPALLAGGHRGQAVARLYRVSADPASGAGDLAFDGLRLLGLVVVMIGLAQLVREGLGRLQVRNWEWQEEISTAVLHLERAQEIAADRDHELRNGLAGLTGIAHLLSGPSAGEHESLRHAVLAELERLPALVDAGGVEVPGVVLDEASSAGSGYTVPRC